TAPACCGSRPSRSAPISAPAAAPRRPARPGPPAAGSRPPHPPPTPRRASAKGSAQALRIVQAPRLAPLFCRRLAGPRRAERRIPPDSPIETPIPAVAHRDLPPIRSGVLRNPVAEWLYGPVRFDERFLDEIKSRLRPSDVIG